ncbi:HK97-gp10 family putative phage morphogenesis protein [Phenylobacterium sp.]|uniref:HK97-gp10 family putative phage morphogenesis protein n=1 Tax=Phenylobacterium sp. TaxID=1871053 RepID=UPI0025F79310|nr:HK97-gp10 family putative phage morphogenesis protein [Phenylobacterium sp.]MBX3482533.1 hypothetical protein [Phenylobacterium sp.]MCW5759243.1 hypothetical protein [Phenylobacterium sp.]
MADIVKVEVLGLKQLDEALGQLKLSTAKNVLRRTGRKALAPFDEAWRARAPEHTHALERSGGVGSNLTREQRRSHERESFVEVFAGPGPLPQAIQQEFGNINHPPQPYFRPAWEATKDQVLQIVVDTLGGEIAASARRAAARAKR